MNIFEAWPPLLLITSGLLGLIVGSFLNVVAYRWPIMFRREWQESCAELERELRGEPVEQPPPRPSADRFDLWWPPSACPGCGAAIAPHHNIPVISYLFLRGRCASCSTPISKRYPIVEAVSGAMSVAVAAHFGPTWATLAGLVFTWFLIALTLIDLDEQLLPDSMTLPLLWIGLLLSLAPLEDGPILADLESSVIGAAAGYLSLWSVNSLFRLLRKKDGMGAGDFKLLAAIGAWLGWQSLLPVIVLSSAVGSVVGLGLVVFREHAPEKPIPFGPYLAGGGWIALLWGRNLIDWYLELMA